MAKSQRPKTKGKEARFQEALSLRDSGRRGEAERVLRDLLAEEPADLRTVLVLGGLLFVQDRYEESLPLFASVLASRPQNEPASLGLFHSLWHLGRREEAFAEMERFLLGHASKEYSRLLLEFRQWLAEEGTDIPAANIHRILELAGRQAEAELISRHAPESSRANEGGKETK